MSAKEREIRLRIVATDTHCGAGVKLCQRLGLLDGKWRCEAFGVTLGYTLDIEELPARSDMCIAAEGAGQKGADR